MDRPSHGVGLRSGSSGEFAIVDEEGTLIGTVDAAQRLLAASGVAVVEGPVPRTSADGCRGESVYFRDPDANLLELLCTEEGR